MILCFGMLAPSVGAYDIRDVRAPACASRIVYGYSGEGRELVAYKFGNGSNVLVAGFGIHGWEDNFNRDGGCLVYTADQLMKQLDQNRRLITDYGWTVYVLPSLNPDGLIDGYTCDGPGRCTTTYLDANGNLVRGRGVDLNRSFPHGWYPYTSERNFNGSQPLSAREAQALAAFVRDVRGNGTNICLDVHGWYTQTITSTGREGTLFQTFSKRFPRNTFANCATAIGYFTAYTTSLGYQSCLFEFPGGIYSMDAFRRSGYCEDFNASVLDLLKICGTYNGHSRICPSVNFSDVVPWAWYHESVDYVVENGIFNGQSSTQFAPNTTMNRAMLVTTLWRMSGSPVPDPDDGSSVAEPVEDPVKPPEEDSPDVPGEDPEDPGEDLPEEPEQKGFTDVVPGTWYSDAVAWAADNGIVNGYPDGSFRPKDPLTREQMAAIFFRYAGWSGRSVSEKADLSAFPDASSVSAYAVESMRWACGIGLIQGMSSGKQTLLMPKGTATRAQAAAIIMRYNEGDGKKALTKAPVIYFFEPTVFDGPVADTGN